MINLEKNKLFFEKIASATFDKTKDLVLKHAIDNKRYIKDSISLLKKEKMFKKALIISAGPSLHRNKSLKVLSENNFNGYIIAADGALGACLRNKIIPHFVVSLDPDERRIVRWFGDPQIEDKLDDDYFRRQDLDQYLNTKEVEKNNELIQLVNKYGKDIKAIMCSSAPLNVVKRCIESGMELYWWNPICDDYELSDSLTKKLYTINKLPCMVTGGNVGTAGWVFAISILEVSETVLIGMDFSYPPNTSIRSTQYYEILKEIFPDNPQKGLFSIFNPYLKEYWLTDPAYLWYREVFKQLANNYKVNIYNCTEGGILFGDNIKWYSFQNYLQENS